MKTSLFTTLSFLLLFFSTKLLLASSASHEPVVDINGNEVKSNLNYYVVSFIGLAGGGGLSLQSGINGLCPFDVFQHGSDMQRGTRINFSPHDNSTIIRESTDLNVKFLYRNTICREINPPIWKVSNYDASRGKWFITASGSFEEGNPGAQTLLSWFKIERVGKINGVYKFVHCPSVCGSCAKLCNSLGISSEGRRLVLLPDDEWAFRFLLIPAPENQLITTSLSN